MICPKCGATIKGGYRYVTCPNCGRTYDSTQFEKVEEPAPAPESTAVPEPTPVAESAPAAEPSPIDEPINDPEQTPAPESTPVPKLAPASEPELFAESALKQKLGPAPESTPEPVPEPDSELKQVPSFGPASSPEPEPASSSQPVSIPDPAPSTKPEPVSVPEPVRDSITLPKKYLIALLGLVGIGVIASAAAALAIYFNSNSTHNSSSSYTSSSNTFSESSITIGNQSFKTILFGNIEWIILDVEGDKTLLLTKDCIEERALNKDVTSVTWESCTLRSYLNGTWYENTFSEGEKDKILTTDVINSDSAEYDTSGGNDTKDKVFLLSLDEVEQYFSSDDERVAKYSGEVNWWWLRSPGFSEVYAAYVELDGDVYSDGDLVINDLGGIRPAIWVNL